MEIDEKLKLQRTARIYHNVNNSRIPLHTRKTRRLNRINRVDDNAAALDAIIDLLEGEISPPLLLLIGIPGVGKTTLCYAAAWEFLEDALTVQYWQTEELLNELQWNLEDGKRFSEIWIQLRNADLLILDDIGAHNPTKWRDSQLDAMIDFRYREEAPLILTANQVDLSDRITDRIKEGRTAMITGKSWRSHEAGRLAKAERKAQIE